MQPDSSSTATQQSQIAAYEESYEVIGCDAYEALIDSFKELCQTADGSPELIAEARRLIGEVNLSLVAQKATAPKDNSSSLCFPDDRVTRHGSRK